MDKYIVSCGCGCGNALDAKILDGEVYVSFLSSDFYTKQERVSASFRLTALLLCSWKIKHKVLKDILCTREELLEFKKFLLSAEYKEDFKSQDNSHIVVDYDKDFGFMIMLISDQKSINALRFKNHRLYDLALSKADRDVLVRRINHALKKEKHMNENKE